MTKLFLAKSRDMSLMCILHGSDEKDYIGLTRYLENWSFSGSTEDILWFEVHVSHIVFM